MANEDGRLKAPSLWGTALILAVAVLASFPAVWSAPYDWIVDWVAGG